MQVTTTEMEETLIEVFGNRIAALDPSNPLTVLRREAIDHALKLGMPARKAEAYKYTPVTDIIHKNIRFAKPVSAASWTEEEIRKAYYEVEEANHLVFINGHFSLKHSIVKSGASQLSISTLNGENLAPEAVSLLGKLSPEQDVFAAQNLAMFNEGLFLHAQIKQVCLPTFIYQFVDSEASASIFPRILILAEAQCQLQIFEKTFVKGEYNYLINSVVETEVKAGAEARFTKIQQYHTNSFHIEAVYAHQHRDSRFYTNTYTFRAALVRNNVAISIDAENCEGHMNGLYLVDGKTHVDNNTTVDHRKAHSYSNELYKGIIDGQAKAVFNGKIYVRPNAQKTNAFQANNNILLSETGTIHTKPQLEIWADDVKCSHGCTTGQLDEEAVFYLRSRGIEKNQAKGLLLNAFANETLSEIGHELVREEIEGLILNRLS